MLLKVKVSPSSKHSDFKKISDDKFIVSVKEPTKQNMANKAVLSLLALRLGISAKSLRIISGHRRSSKIIICPPNTS